MFILMVRRHTWRDIELAGLAVALCPDEWSDGASRGASAARASGDGRMGVALMRLDAHAALPDSAQHGEAGLVLPLIGQPLRRVEFTSQHVPGAPAGTCSAAFCQLAGQIPQTAPLSLAL
jgi:hypothetical protein